LISEEFSQMTEFDPNPVVLGSTKQSSGVTAR
jgi:hypothetical protein